MENTNTFKITIENLIIIESGKPVTIESLIINKNDKYWQDYPIVNLSLIRPGLGKLSNTVLHLSTRSLGVDSSVMRDQLLLPIARITEDYYPKRINWLETFFDVEENLLSTAYSGGKKSNEYGTEISNDFEEVISLSDEVKQDLDNRQKTEFIKRKLIENSLPINENG